VIPEHLQPTREQKAELRALMRSLEQIEPDTDWAARARELVGVPKSHITKSIYADLIERLQRELETLINDSVPFE
jgi:hypothetical protein